MSYSTKQHQAVLRCLEQRAEEALTAADLAEDLLRAGCPVGLATIYRQLERLEKQGLVHKLVTDEGACWQYCDCHAHRDCILLKCEVCGAIQHMDCGHLGELYQHVLQQHHFRINPRRTLFYGLCDRCSGEESS